jgi:preprotein translocase subunit SecF
MKLNLFDFYYKNYKKLILIPIILLVFNLSVLAYNYFSTGSIVNMDSSLKGGVTLTFNYDTEIDSNALKAYLMEKLETDDIDIVLLANQLSGKIIGYEILAESSTSKDLLLSNIEDFINDELDEENISFGLQGSAIGDNFIKESSWLFIIGFLLIFAVSYIFFKEFIPALTINISTLSDIIGILAVFNLMGIKIGSVTIGALLMIIGYSSDSDLLLASSIFKKKDGNLKDRLGSAVKTQFTMNLTALITFVIMFALSSVDAIKQISLVLIIGIFFDLINTWLASASIQRVYLENKEAKR